MSSRPSRGCRPSKCRERRQDASLRREPEPLAASGAILSESPLAAMLSAIYVPLLQNGRGGLPGRSAVPPPVSDSAACPYRILPPRLLAFGATWAFVEPGRARSAAI